MAIQSDRNVILVAERMINVTIPNSKSIDRTFLQELIDNKVSEDKELEYKSFQFIDGKIPDKVKDDLLKEITAFANTNGGIIIVGIREDDNHNPAELIGVGFSEEKYEEWLASFNQIMLSRIKPRLHGISCTPVKLDGENIAIVISVPKSYARPHCRKIGNREEFHIRTANIVTNMDIDDLRKSFLYSNGLQDKIRQFHNDRISMILANECIGDMGIGPKIIFHIIPEWSFELGNLVDLHPLYSDPSFRPISGSGWDHRYNADGYCIFTNNAKNIIGSYTQVFHNGIIEAGEIRLFSEYRANQIYDWSSTQSALIRALDNYEKILDGLQIPKPWHIFASILNGKGCVSSNGWGDMSLPLDRNIVNSLGGICTDEISLHTALKPVFDSLSHAFGFAGSNFI